MMVAAGHQRNEQQDREDQIPRLAADRPHAAEHRDAYTGDRTTRQSDK